MPWWAPYRPPAPEDGAAWAAEQRWRLAEAAIARQLAYVSVGIVAILGATGAAALYGQLTLARVLCAGIFVCLGRTIFLLVKQHRVFMDIKMAGGLTREEARSEMLSRYSD